MTEDMLPAEMEPPGEAVRRQEETEALGAEAPETPQEAVREEIIRTAEEPADAEEGAAETAEH